MNSLHFHLAGSSHHPVGELALANRFDGALPFAVINFPSRKQGLNFSFFQIFAHLAINRFDALSKMKKNSHLLKPLPLWLL